jgi:Protein of unknown function (DUF2917)
MHPTHAKRKENTMRLELESGALQLRRGQTLRVVDGAGSTVCAREGTVWITEENRMRDVVLEAGACYELAGRGVAVIEALGEAELTLI